MADSYRLKVLKRLTTHLETIAIADDYNFDLAGKVFRGREFFGDQDPKTMISILEQPRPTTGIYAGENDSERLESWPLLIHGWTVDDKVNPTDPLYQLMDDVEKCLARITATLKGSGYPKYPDEYMLKSDGEQLITGLTVSPGIVRPSSPNVSQFAFFYLPLYVGLVRSSS